MKVLFLLALTFFTVVSTIATVAATFNISALNSFSITKTAANFIGLGDIQLTGGDPVDNPVAPD